MFIHKRSHKLALKRSGRYLKQMKDSGFVSNPDSDVCKVDAYPDAEFFWDVLT